MKLITLSPKAGLVVILASLGDLHHPMDIIHSLVHYWHKSHSVQQSSEMWAVLDLAQTSCWAKKQLQVALSLPL